MQTEILSKEGNELCFLIIGITHDNVENHSSSSNVTINIRLLLALFNINLKLKKFVKNWEEI